MGASALAGCATVPPVPRAFSDPARGRVPDRATSHHRLVVGATPVNITGRTTLAPAVDGCVPGPVLRWREGDEVTLDVVNTLDETTSIHWHGVRVPSDMDGVPGLSFAGIPPGESFTYRFAVRQSGTYWYHSHSNMQEGRGLYGAIVIDPAGRDPNAVERDYVVVLSDWTDTPQERIESNLKFDPDTYSFRQRTAASLVGDAGREGLGAALADRLRWSRMRMNATDISDVSAVAYTYLMNGLPPDANWTALFAPGERVRLRFINAAVMTLFDVRIPGLSMQVVQADGNDVVPVAVDEFRIGVAETYDVIVTPQAGRAYSIFVQSEDRTGYARGTIAEQAGQVVAIPPMDPRPVRTMMDMGMGTMDMKGGAMSGMAMPMTSPVGRTVENQNVASMPIDRVGDPGDGLRDNGRRVLRYADLRALRPGRDPRPPGREITLHLTGNMERYIWGFDGRKFSEAPPIGLRLGERVRFVLINDTMMEHPIHLHGLWSELENGQGAFQPYKHTIISQPGSRLTYLVTADVPGQWAYHCHLMFHMELGMFRTVVVS
ncbi:copper resistance protein CopA [Ameyamaea chiangmaiensis NBRC 103196]|nr:copper resistance protein CopA [Ameyamaea chiangmaiensis NBRC 103196]